jgi:hypothetical protein
VSTLRVFVDGVGIDVPAGGTALDAIVAHAPERAEGVRNGSMLVTDSRGLPVSADTALFNGAVFRTIPNRERDAADPAQQFDT